MQKIEMEVSKLISDTNQVRNDHLKKAAEDAKDAAASAGVYSKKKSEGPKDIPDHPDKIKSQEITPAGKVKKFTAKSPFSDVVNEYDGGKYPFVKKFDSLL